jgi:hypothetical protein
MVHRIATPTSLESSTTKVYTVQIEINRRGSLCDLLLLIVCKPIAHDQVPHGLANILRIRITLRQKLWCQTQIVSGETVLVALDNV